MVTDTGTWLAWKSATNSRDTFQPATHSSLLSVNSIRYIYLPELVDTQGKVCAIVDKTIYIRKK